MRGVVAWGVRGAWWRFVFCFWDEEGRCLWREAELEEKEDDEEWNRANRIKPFLILNK